VEHAFDVHFSELSGHARCLPPSTLLTLNGQFNMNVFMPVVREETAGKLQTMKRWHYFGIISLLVTASLLGAGALVVDQSRVPSEAIASSVTRTPELINRAWQLPVAATFHRYVISQSNGSRCGPAAVANAYRSLGEGASTEGKMLAGTGRCWTGVCI